MCCRVFPGNNEYAETTTRLINSSAACFFYGNDEECHVLISPRKTFITIEFPMWDISHKCGTVLRDCFTATVSRQSKAMDQYTDVIMCAVVSQITSLTSVHSTVCSGSDQRKHHGSASLAFARGIYRWLVDSPHKGPVTRKKVPFDDVITTSDLCLFMLWIWHGEFVSLSFHTWSQYRYYFSHTCYDSTLYLDKNNFHYIWTMIEISLNRYIFHNLENLFPKQLPEKTLPKQAPCKAHHLLVTCGMTSRNSYMPCTV